MLDSSFNVILNKLVQCIFVFFEMILVNFEKVQVWTMNDSVSPLSLSLPFSLLLFSYIHYIKLHMCIIYIENIVFLELIFFLEPFSGSSGRSNVQPVSLVMEDLRCLRRNQWEQVEFVVLLPWITRVFCGAGLANLDYAGGMFFCLYPFDITSFEN